MEFIGRIYCFFESLFGQQLGEYLMGYNCETGDYTNPALFSRMPYGLFLSQLGDRCALLLYHKQ